MSNLDWRKAKLGGKRTLSTRDEKTEFKDKDAAARWLARNEKAKAKPSSSHRQPRLARAAA